MSANFMKFVYRSSVGLLSVIGREETENVCPITTKNNLTSRKTREKPTKYPRNTREIPAKKYLR